MRFTRSIFYADMSRKSSEGRSRGGNRVRNRWNSTGKIRRSSRRRSRSSRGRDKRSGKVGA